MNQKLFGTEPPTQRVGRFVLLEQVGAGAMGRVYAAYDPELDRKIALKLIRSTEPSAMGQRRARLLREAKSMARLSHPNVLPVYDAGVHGEEVFIAMEFVRGGTLRQWLKQEERGWREVLRVFVEAGRGLEAAHAAQVVHRDFKPDNVLIGEDGRVRVVDFGLARAPATDPDEAAPTEPSQLDPDSVADSKLTRTGAVMGTPAYMSPEQFEGEEADARSDQFSFCVSLWEGLYGRRPFRGKDMFALVDAINSRDYVPVPRGARAPGWIREALERGLSARPSARFPGMAQLLAELDRDPDARRRRWLGVVGGAGMLAAGAMGYAVVDQDATALCQGGVERLAGVWDEERRQAVQRAFDATGRSFSTAAWEGASKVLDEFSAEWVSMHREVCEATQVRGEQSQALMDRRMVCLERRRSALRATVETFVDADVGVVERAVEAARALPEVSVCGETSLLDSMVEPPGGRRGSGGRRSGARASGPRASARRGGSLRRGHGRGGRGGGPGRRTGLSAGARRGARGSGPPRGGSG